MEITKREALFSICIIVLFLVGGLSISNKISDSILDSNQKYNKAVKIEDTELFQYGMDTNAGNAFVYGKLETVDPVTFSEIGGKYMYVRKVKEKYTMHTRVVTYTDSKGRSHSRTETYWSWDYAGEESKTAKKIKFNDVVFDFGKINRPDIDYIDTINESGHIRYKYYGTPTTFKGTIFTDLRDGTITDGSNFYENKTLEETHDLLVKSDRAYVALFWCVWILLTGLAVYGFYVLDNRWLE